MQVCILPLNKSLNNPSTYLSKFTKGLWLGTRSDCQLFNNPKLFPLGGCPCRNQFLEPLNLLGIYCITASQIRYLVKESIVNPS